MFKRNQPCCPRLPRLMTLLVALAIAAATPDSLLADTPESPHVQEMIKKAEDFLQKADTSKEEFGGKALIAYTLVKIERARTPGKGPLPGRTQAKVDDAISAIRKVMNADHKKFHGFDDLLYRLYGPSISVMLLCELDEEKYKADIQKLLDYLDSRQRADGSFGYASTEWGVYGDTSMMQYVILASWYAKNHGFQISNETAKQRMNWLISTQLPNGGFVYRPRGPSGPDTKPTRTMAVAGTGSLYMIGNFTGAISEKIAAPKGQGAGELPTTVTYAPAEGKANEPGIRDTGPLLAAVEKGDRWIKANYGYDTDKWWLYSMYGAERYMAFHDIAHAIDEEEPEWYNTGVAHLKKKVQTNGSWAESENETHTTAAIHTCFATMFLLRNTRASAKEFESGAMEGVGKLGDGKLALINGKIGATAVTKDVDDVMNLAKNATPDDWDAFRQSLNKLKISNEPKKREAELQKLRYLVKHKDFAARIIAVEQLARRRDFKGVPDMIYALGDPDKRVAIAANDALRVLSRKFETDDVKGDGKPTYSDSELEAFSRIKRNWKTWYRQRKPDAVFID